MKKKGKNKREKEKNGRKQDVWEKIGKEGKKKGCKRNKIEMKIIE